MSAGVDGLVESLSQGLGKGGWIPAFEHAFMVRACLAGLLLSPLLGLISPVVLGRRLAFFSAAIGHTALTGLALGVLLGSSLEGAIPVMFLFCLGVSLGLTFLRRHTSLSEDGVIGVVLAGSLGLGIALLALAARQFDIHQIEGVMFGNLLTLTSQDLSWLGCLVPPLFLLTLGGIAPWIHASLDEPLARTWGRDTQRQEYLLMTILTLAILASIKFAGFLLVEGLVILPAVTARLLAWNLRSYLFFSWILAILATQVGLTLSYLFPIPSGAAILLALLGLFLLALPVHVLKRGRGALALSLALGLASGGTLLAHGDHGPETWTPEEEARAKAAIRRELEARRRRLSLNRERPTSKSRRDPRSRVAAEILGAEGASEPIRILVASYPARGVLEMLLEGRPDFEILDALPAEIPTPRLDPSSTAFRQSLRPLFQEADAVLTQRSFPLSSASARLFPTARAEKIRVVELDVWGFGLDRPRLPVLGQDPGGPHHLWLSYSHLVGVLETLSEDLTRLKPQARGAIQAQRDLWTRTLRDRQAAWQDAFLELETDRVRVTEKTWDYLLYDLGLVPGTVGPRLGGKGASGPLEIELDPVWTRSAKDPRDFFSRLEAQRGALLQGLQRESRPRDR